MIKDGVSLHLHLPRRPHHHIQSFGKVEQRRRPIKREVVRREEFVGWDVGGGGLERPRGVMDFGAEDVAARRLGIEAIALGEPVFEGAGFGFVWTGGGHVGSGELFVGVTFATLASVVEAVVRFTDRHIGPNIGQMKESTGGPNGQDVGGIKAEKPDAGFAFIGYIEPNVEFGKSGNPR